MFPEHLKVSEVNNSKLICSKFLTQRKVKVLALSVDQQVKSLSSVQSQYQGFDGEDGGRKNCFGRNGAVLYIRVSHTARC